MTTPTNPDAATSGGFENPRTPATTPAWTAQAPARAVTDPYVETYPQTTGDADRSAGADQSTSDVAADQAGQLKDTTIEAGQQVASTAKDEASQVLGEAKDQASSLLASVSSEVKQQAGTQQQRLAEAVNSMATELGGMASASTESGPLTDLAQEASRKGGEISSWLENREPSDLIQEVKRFARRRPVTFLLLCGAAGVLAGRVTRGAVAANTAVDSPSATPSTPALATHPFEQQQPVTYPATAQAPTFVAPTIYESTPESSVYAPAAGQTGTDRPGLR